MSRPTILEVAAIIAERSGHDPLTPRWEAVHRVMYGLPLRPQDVDCLEASTRCSRAAIEQLAAMPQRGPMRELWARVGRRGRKSLNAALIAIYEAVWGGHEAYMLPGERGLVAVMSATIASTTVVARFCGLFAETLGLKSSWTTMGSVRVLTLDGVAVGVACFAANSVAPRGYPLVAFIGDEFAHLPEGDDYQNTAAENLAAARPAMAQFPDAKLIVISTPMGASGVFHESVEAALGDDAPAGVLAVQGPTWEWNPEITRERTLELAPDPSEHAQEFGAVAEASQTAAFPDAARCFEPRVGRFHWGQAILAIDPASVGNTFACLALRWGQPSGQRVFELREPPPGSGLSPECMPPAVDAMGQAIELPAFPLPLLAVHHVFGWTGEELRATSMDVVAAELATVARRFGADVIVSDRHGDVFIAALLSRHRIKLRSFTQTLASKHQAATYLRTLMRDGQLILPQHPQLRRDVETYPRRIVGGTYRYGGPPSRSGHHWDYASALMIAAHSMLEQPQAADPSDGWFEIVNAPTTKHRDPRHVGRSR